jgi:hypothetical protein
MTQEKINVVDMITATTVRGASSTDVLDLTGVYVAECYDSKGNLKWSDTINNTVTTAGKNSLLDVYLRNQTQIATWYFGLISSISYSAIAVGDTIASHSGWTEAGSNVPNYSESVRQTAAWSAASSGSISTSAAAAFSITSSGTLKGAFLISNSTKNGTTGVLYSAGLFTVGDKVVSSGDTVNVTYTASA